METIYRTQAAPGGANQDFVVSGPTWVAVFDGATPRAGVDSGCIHTVTWLVSELAAWLSLGLMRDPGQPLDESLRLAIASVCGLHRDSCDLDNPDSPSSTVAIIRLRGDELDYLVLGDSPILLDTRNGIHLVTDERSAKLPSYTPESVREHRNQPHGFWVASTQPKAAYQAVCGSVSISELNQVALFTDGATRYVDKLGLGTWLDLLTTLDTAGPTALFEQIRETEKLRLPLISQEPSGRIVKRHDDATAVLVKSLETLPQLHNLELFLRKEYLRTAQYEITDIDAYNDYFDQTNQPAMHKLQQNRRNQQGGGTQQARPQDDASEKV